MLKLRRHFDGFSKVQRLAGYRTLLELPPAAVAAVPESYAPSVTFVAGRQVRLGGTHRYLRPEQFRVFIPAWWYSNARILNARLPEGRKLYRRRIIDATRMARVLQA